MPICITENLKKMQSKIYLFEKRLRYSEKGKNNNVKNFLKRNQSKDVETSEKILEAKLVEILIMYKILDRMKKYLILRMSLINPN